MGRLDPDFTADGIFANDDLADMKKAFEVACLQLGALADNGRVRQAMALVVAQHYELGIRQRTQLVEAARETGRMVGLDMPERSLTFFG